MRLDLVWSRLCFESPPGTQNACLSPLRVLRGRSALRLLQACGQGRSPSGRSHLAARAVAFGSSRWRQNKLERNDMDSVKQEKKKPRGGPQPLPAEELRAVEIKVRYTRPEHAQATASAANAGLALAVFARELTLKNKVIKSAPSPEYVSHYQALARTTANLNQLTHAVNVQLLHGINLDQVIVGRLEDLTVLLGILGDDIDRLRSILVNKA